MSLNWYDSYQQKVTKNGYENSLRDSNINSYMDTISYGFEDNISYFKIYQLQTDGTYSNNFKDSWIIDNKTAYDDKIPKKKVIMKPQQQINRGEVYKIDKWDNQEWLVTEEEPSHLYTNEAQITLCNNTFSFKNKSGKLITLPCVLQAKNPYSPGIKDFPDLTLGDTQRYMEISNIISPYTNDIRRDMEYIIDDLNYRITSIDRTTRPEICAILWTEYQNGTKTDRTYTINIQEQQLNLNVGNSKQLTIIIKRDEDVVKRDIIWESSNTDIATIDNNGLVTCIKDGTCNITAKLKDNESIVDNCQINVSAVIVDSISYDFDKNSQSNTIGIGMSKTYAFYKYNNASPQVDTFKFSINYGNVNNKICTLEIIDGNKCKVVANKKEMLAGKVLLEVRDMSDVLVGSKEINIKWL